MKKFQRALIKEARRLGFENLKIVPGGRHPRLTGTYRKQPFELVIPGTPSDHRSFLNTRAYLRRHVREWSAAA